MARPKAPRHSDIVFGALDERLEMLAEAATPEVVASNISRIRELVSELRRSLGKPERTTDDGASE